MTNKNQDKVIIYQNPDDTIELQVQVEGDTVWLNQAQMASLFGRDVNTVSEHIQNVFTEKELTENSVSRKFRVTGSDRKVYNVKHYRGH